MAVPDAIRSDQRGLLDSAVHDTAAKLAQYHEVFDVIPCDDVLEDIIRHDQNFLGLWHKTAPENGLEHRWWGVSQIPQTITIVHSVLGAGSGTTFTIPNAQKGRIIPRTMIIDPRAPAETMQVATVGADDSGNGSSGTLITVVRGITGDNSAAHTTTGTTTFQIMDTPYPEASSPEIMRLNEPTWFKNTFEMFERWLELSRHQVKAKVKYVDDYFGWLVEQNSIDVLDELAYAFLHGQWASPWMGSKTVARRTRGLLEQLKATTDADGQTIVPNVSSTATVFDLDAVETLSRMIDDAKGSLPNGHGVLMLDVDMYDAAMDIWDDRMIMIDRTETTVGRKVRAIETKRDHTLSIMKDRRWPKGYVAILNPADMEYKAFVDSDWVAEMYAKTKDAENWRLYGDYMTIVRSAQKNFSLLTNVTVS